MKWAIMVALMSRDEQVKMMMFFYLQDGIEADSTKAMWRARWDDQLEKHLAKALREHCQYGPIYGRATI